MSPIGDTGDVQKIIWRINDAWIDGRLDELAACLDPNMVIVAPGFRERIEGRDACVASYGDFVQNASIHDFEASDLHVDRWGDTAVGVYSYRIIYEMKGSVHEEWGRDLYVFSCREGEWRAVWRHVTKGT